MAQTLIRLLTLCSILLGYCTLHAQVINDVHKYDGEHKNETWGYMTIGDNVITDFFFGMEMTYKRHLSDRWYVQGDAQMQLGKKLYSVATQGAYRLPWGWSDFYVKGKVMYNHYQRWHTNELDMSLGVTWEMPYFYFHLGASYIYFHMLDFGYWEPLTMNIGAGVNIRPRWNSWNIGVFARNYDDFYYEGYNLNWGVNFYANLKKDLRLFGEVNIRPAGSMSQLATKYENSFKIGLKHVW